MAITKIGTPELFDFSATNTALQLPTGDTASRPSAPSAGEWRFNSELKYVEYWDGGSPGAWRQIDTESSAVFTPSENFNVNTYTGNGGTQILDAKFNEAGNFDGSSSYIQSPSLGLQFAGNNTLSISLWFKGTKDYFQTLASFSDTNDASTEMTITIRGDQPNDPISIFNRNGGTYNIEANGPASVIDGNWHNVVLTGDSSGNKLYLDGSELTLSYANGSGSTTLAMPSGINSFSIGSNIDSTGPEDHFQGQIDQVRVFNTALTAAQVTDLYTNETTTTAATLNFPAGAGCVAAYQLDGNGNDISTNYNGTTTNIGYTGLKFTPDLTWIKILDLPYDNNLYDTVRGADGGSGAADKVLTSNKTTAQEQGLGDVTIQTNAVKVVETVGSPSSSEVNKNGDDFVSWNFKAGGAPTDTNSAGAGNVPTSGSVMIDGVASTTALTGTAAVKKISANTAAGFSIVTFSNNASAANTFDHKLGGQPELVFIKGTDVSNDWFTYVDSLGKDKRLKLNSSDNVSNWISNDGTNTPTGINATTLSFAYSGTTYNFIAYLFRSIDKYQKIGSYLGTALSNNFVQTDFTPSFVLIKSSSLTSTNWVIIDSKRSSGTLWLYPNTSDDEEGPYTNTALNSNGFTVDGNSSYVNSSGETYIYLAIAQ